MSLINISNLTFGYDGSYDDIFENVSFQIDTDWRLGFTGRNGRGKTTFLNLLLGKYEYKGKISASVNFEYFPFDVPDINSDTIDVINNIIFEYNDWELYRELSLLDIDDSVLYRSFKTLSNGERTKVLLAALFLKENNFPLIDEPTNHLDMKGRLIVSDYLKSKKGFILVSHDRAFLDNCIDHILSINKTGIEIQRGNFSSWLINKERRDTFEFNENERLQKDIKHLKQAARQNKEWADKAEASKIGKGHADIEKSISSRSYIGEKSRRMQQRRKNLERRQQTAIEEKTKLLKNIETAENLKISPLSYHANRLITLENISIHYGSRKVCKDVNLVIEQGDRVALLGKNGAGKTSLLKLICGENIDFEGSLYNSGLIFSYVSQDTAMLEGTLTDYAQKFNIEESLLKAILRKLGFSRVQFEKNMRDFSGGQKKKVLIAKSLCEKAHLYIWDEPLNFIDIISRLQIEELILNYKPTLLFVEHDAAFCENIATKKIIL